MNEVKVKDISGNEIFSTPIDLGSKRKFQLMKEDYVILKFSLVDPVFFKLGYYIDLPNDPTGLFDIVDLQKPTYNDSTGGYDYELRLDAYYWKWKNKKFFYTPENAGREAGWSLTATLYTHLVVFLKNLSVLGYDYRGTAFKFEIDYSVVSQSAKLVTYDNTNLIDALSLMAETWECEWWITNHVIHFGKCEFGDPIDLESGVNVEAMERSDSQSTYATRIYAFGSTRNIPDTYRKKLVFDVKSVNGRRISDTSRKLDAGYFPVSSYRNDDDIVLSYEKPYSIMTNSPAKYSVLIPVSKNMPAGKYSIQADNITAGITDPNQVGLTVRNFKSTFSIEYVTGGETKQIEIQTKTEEREGKYTPTVKFDNAIFTLEGDASECSIRIDSSVEFIIDEANIHFNIACYGVVKNENKGADVTVTFISGGNAGKTFDAVYNPEYKAGEESNVIELPEGVTASSGDMYTIDNIIKGKVPTNYFSKDDAELTVSGVVQKRLMLPSDVPYVDAYRYSPTGERIYIGDPRYDSPHNVEMPVEEAVEEIVIFEDEYAKYIGSTTEVPEPDIVEEEDSEGNKTGNTHLVYTFKDAGLKDFYDNYRIKGEDIRVIFQTGKLAGLDFVVELKDSSDSGTTFEIVPNEDYGRLLPDDVLFPQSAHVEDGKKIPADTYILYGFDTAFLSEDMLPNAEKELLSTTRKYIKKTMVDPSTYSCTMMSDVVYDKDGNHRLFEAGDRVNLINKGYFENGRQSRVIGFEYNLDIPYDSPVYMIGETAPYSRIGEIESKIDSLAYKGQTYSSNTSVSGGGTSVYVIGVNDNTVPSDRNVFSAKNSLSKFLRKDIPNSADELITFIKGLVSESMISAQDGVQFGKSFASGLTGHGGLIDSLGRGELESLVLRSFLEVPELRYNRIRVTAGDLWLSPGGGLIESVEPDMDMEGNLLDTGTVTLKLESGEIGTIAVDDLCMGMYHYESGNATEDYDDGIGNRRMSGFSTCYFRITEILETATNSKFRYKLRDSSDNYPNPIAPASMMHFVSYGNASNELRQSSIYLKGSGNPYIRILKEVNWWEFSFKNIGCQFGYLDNLKIFGVDTTGYSAFINSLYFYGKIEQLEKIVEDTLGDGDLRMEIKNSEDAYVFVDNNIDVILTAKVFKYFKDITSEVVKWVWTRESGTSLADIASDAIWNDNNSSARESVHITAGDITTDSVKFICEATIGNITIRKEETFK